MFGWGICFHELGLHEWLSLCPTFEYVSKEIFGHISVFQVQPVKCCDIMNFLYPFGIHSTYSITLIVEVLNINWLLLKLDQFICTYIVCLICVGDYFGVLHCYKHFIESIIFNPNNISSMHTT